MSLTPDEFAATRGHNLGPVKVKAGKYEVRTCKRCGARLVVSEENQAGFGYALEADCARADRGGNDA